ncbi:GTP 3',8-cyclase MoaA [Lentibacillus sp. CBA3610]|uniref:GTP 3',8-cyclase MoaA n=1 Tax=Lentibacillus sp. CBA3610 TaxID=2518176 RepID=UPI0015957C58|nr:GTP 3',8-cyclase MoaA [Lentibacillus sp. CBA3610]QKY68884.1 GTP 3',8-cyclase MoaA [Lentibacillus sp. CBA3610]
MNNETAPIKDHFGRVLKDLRISVIDKCNFRCTYCMPKEIFGEDYVFLSEKELLSFDEIIRLAKVFADLGVEKIRITGGEPLMRRNLDHLIAELADIPGIKDIALTTNAVMLTKMAEKLKEAGLKRVNVSLDAIEDDVFKAINDRGVGSSPVLKGIEAAKQAGLGVKINMVVKKGMNDSQVLPMARYFKGKDVILRFIEFMDVGNHNGWDFKHVFSKKDIVNIINEEMPIEPAEENYYGEVASRYRYKDGGGEIGVISSVTDSFCGTCTRIRLSADGKLYTCLFASGGFDVRDKMREDELSDNELEQELTGLWARRRDRYSEERTEETHRNRKKIEMSYIGG